MLASAFFLLPLLFVLSLYGYFAIVPAWQSLSKSMTVTFAGIGLNQASQFEYIYEWLALPYLLATFGYFIKEEERTRFP